MIVTYGVIIYGSRMETIQNHLGIAGLTITPGNLAYSLVFASDIERHHEKKILKETNDDLTLSDSFVSWFFSSVLWSVGMWRRRARAGKEEDDDGPLTSIEKK